MERISKIIARSGYCSRRAAEEIISAKRVKLNGNIVETLGTKADYKDIILIDNKPIDAKDESRLWLYNKSKGLITTHKDPNGRKTVFEALPENMPRVISVGRLDFNSEGLLLLTNDGELARFMEMPQTGWRRKYKVRVFGNIDNLNIKELTSGVTIDSINYKPIEIELENQKGDNSWFIVTLKEGKNREIRKIFEHYGLKVNRLIRIAYGPFQLGNLSVGEVKEVPKKILNDQLRINNK
ncbi:MAG: pseudouridine synthase [Alphaproteobacteria bacterium]